MKREDVDRFEKVNAQVQGIHDEVGALAKKSPNDGVNKFKLALINSVVAEANDVLGETYRPFDTFESFDENELPSNSDVTFILAQYLNCLEKLRADNISQGTMGRWEWNVKSESRIYTAAPKKLREK